MHPCQKGNNRSPPLQRQDVVHLKRIIKINNQVKHRCSFRIFFQTLPYKRTIGTFQTCHRGPRSPTCAMKVKTRKTRTSRGPRSASPRVCRLCEADCHSEKVNQLPMRSRRHRFVLFRFTPTAPGLPTWQYCRTLFPRGKKSEGANEACWHHPGQQGHTIIHSSIPGRELLDDTPRTRQGLRALLRTLSRKEGKTTLEPDAHTSQAARGPVFPD